MVLVDTSVWIDFFRGAQSEEVEKLEKLFESERIIIGDLIIVELLQGFRFKREQNAIKEVIELLEYRDMVGRILSEKAAENFRELRKKGVTIRKIIDVLIGTFCIENGISLLHRDRDFDPLEKYLKLRVL